MDSNDMALEALRTSNGLEQDRVPFEAIEQTYRLLVNRVYERDESSTMRMMEEIAKKYLEGGRI